MSDEIERKFLKPAHEGACIPDPAHPGIDLPQAGSEVPWDHYWISRERRGEVIIVDLPTADRAPAPIDAPVETAHDPVPSPNAGIPFMITKAMREKLRQRGFDDAQIATMTPEAARIELSAE